MVEGTPLEELWTRTAGRGLGGAAAYVDTVIYFGAADRHVIAVDLRNGAIRWRTRVPGPIAVGVVADDRRVYTHTERPDGRVYAMDRLSGTKLWTTSAGSSAAPPALTLPFAGSVRDLVLERGCFGREENEEIGGNLDLANIVRSRMPGVLGLTFRFRELSPEAGDTIATEIQRYKAYRNILTQANATLLSRQAPVFDGWDVLQEVTDDGLYGMIFAFKGPLSDDHIRVNPRGLVPDSMYDVYSADVGFLGTAAGESLMADGIEIVHAPGGSDAHLLVLTGTPSDQRLRR